MDMVYELVFSQIQRKCEAFDLGFSSTKELEPLNYLYNQEEVCRSLDFALRIDCDAHIFVGGADCIGKTACVLDIISNINSEFDNLRCDTHDICYVYNFDDELKPLALLLPCGMGEVFKADMDDFVYGVYESLQKCFSADCFVLKRQNIMSRFLQKRMGIMEKISRIALNYAFVPRFSDEEIYFLPTIDGAVINDEVYDSLSLSQQKDIEKNSINIHSQTGRLISKLSVVSEELQIELADFEREMVLDVISDNMKYLVEFLDFYDVSEYLENVSGYIFENYDGFMENFSDEVWKFGVNVIVHNIEGEIPVVVAENGCMNDKMLLGEIPIDREGNYNPQDFMQIKGGIFHKANGGYLVMQAKEICDSQYIFEIIMNTLKKGKLDFVPPSAYRRVLGNELELQAVDLKVKLVVVGLDEYYDIFRYYNWEFEKFFPIRIEFDNEMEYNHDNVLDFARAIKRSVVMENGLDVSCDGVCALVDFSNRLAENRNRLSNDFSEILEVLKEAMSWAKINKKDLVTREEIERAIFEKGKRARVWRDRKTKLVTDNIFKIDTVGAVVGQINGMCVSGRSGQEFGLPVRITATTYVGKSGIVNIEKEVNLSGEVHNKGVQIINGWLGQTYAQEFALSFTCRICFEQNYNGIDGDSASSTELYAVISSLADMPIRQDLAVTGSVNQRGEIQAVGGINQKIEGFFELCKQRGFSGTEGVVIPFVNIEDLLVCDEVALAVDKGEFHIYPVKCVEEGMEILMAEKYEVIHRKVSEKLHKFNKLSVK